MVWDCFTCLFLFLCVFYCEPPFSSNALKKVCGHCGIICLVEHCVDKKKRLELYPFFA